MNSESEIGAFVEIDADLFLDARLVADDLAGGDAADRHLALAGAEVLDGEAGDVAADVLERLRVRALDVRLGLRVDREGHVLDARGALGRSHDDVRAGSLRDRRLVGGLSRALLAGLRGNGNCKREYGSADEQMLR